MTQAAPPPPESGKAKRGLRRWSRLALVLALLLAGADQLLHHYWLGNGFLGARRVAPFDPPLFLPRHWSALEDLAGVDLGVPRPGSGLALDPLLGWITAGAGHGPIGQRLYDAPPRAPEHKRIALIGCSFTYGSEVEAQESWIACLAGLRTDLELTNLGVPGYGLDQALLRWERDVLQAGGPHPDEVWIGVMPTALLRLMSIYRPAENHWSGALFFKPRFEVGAQGLSLHALPHQGGGAHAAALIRDQRAFLTALNGKDAFVSRWPAAYEPAGSRLVHYTGFGRITLTWLESRERNVGPWILREEQELARLTRALVSRAASHGPKVRVLILPSARDLEAGPEPWGPLCGWLSADGHEVLDLSAVVRQTPPDWRPEGHYGPEQNAAVARALADL